MAISRSLQPSFQVAKRHKNRRNKQHIFVKFTDSDHDVGGTVLYMLFKQYSITMSTGFTELQIRGADVVKKSIT
jgi:hypothetical protein